MKTEELLRCEAEYKAMRKALGTSLLVFDFPRTGTLIQVGVSRSHEREGMPGKYIAREPNDMNIA